MEFITEPKKSEAKNCYVVLERLDGETMTKYLLKYKSKNILSSSLCESQFPVKKFNTEKPKAILMRKRKVKPLRYSDDEDNDVLSYLESNTNESSTISEEKFSELLHSKKFEGGKNNEFVSSQKEFYENQIVNECDLSLIPSKFCGTDKFENKFSSNINSQKEEDEFVNSDSREDNEDDKETVIFDKEFNTCVELSILEQQAVNCGKTTDTKEKFQDKKSKEVTTVENKGETEYPKMSNVNTVCLNDEYFTEICTLVKRLHELYRTILQLKMEIPKNKELAVHFIKVIKTQQENFHREIRNSQKSIIKCFEKMLVEFTSAEKVALEISKRTFLCPDDVINVLSKCLLVEGACSTENSTNEPEKTCSRKSVCEPKNDAVEIYQIIDQIVPLPCYRSNLKMTRVNDCPLSVETPVDTESSRFMVSAYQYNKTEVSAYQYNKTEVSAYQYNKTEVSAYQYNKTEPFVQSFQNSLPKSQSQVYHDIDKCQFTSSFNSSLSNGPLIKNTSRSLKSHTVPQRSKTLYFVPSNETRQVSLPTVENSNRNNKEKFISSSWNLSSETAFLECIPAEYSTDPSIIGFNQTDISQLSRHKSSLVDSIEIPRSNYANDSVTNRKDFPRKSSSPKTQGLDKCFDPTVPQRLTMKNYRLQAGPVLDSKQVNNGCSVQKQSDCLERQNLKSRAYVCAQTDCKKPGVRICKRCQSVIYCSETCQLKNWTQKHKKECFQLKQLRG